MTLHEWSQHSDTQKGQLTRKSELGFRPKFKLIQVLMLPLLPESMKKFYIKTKALWWSQYIFHYKSMGIFPDTQGQLTPQSDLAEFQTHLRLYGCPCYMKE